MTTNPANAANPAPIPASDFARCATYPKADRIVKSASAVTQSNRGLDTRVNVPPPLPGAVIVIHGVNDVGVAYGAVEEGLCAGFATRLGHQGQPFVPGKYAMPPDKGADKAKLEDDPEAAYFHRQTAPTTHSPVIPFYWGFREEAAKAKPGTNFPHRQNLDRNNNRLDKDFSKEGGPFINATNNIPDMWNRGHGWIPVIDDTRPTFKGPGRLYMVLAAQRLAMLVSMARDYHPKEVVNIVAHSQGTLVTLLSQAFLLQWGRQPADTIVLCNSCFSLEDSNFDVDTLKGEIDDIMKDAYDFIADGQTLHARLQTLVNIVHGVRGKRTTEPPFDDKIKAEGLAGTSWQAKTDRDNRGKVYLYFSPEDMTVSLRGMQGIGWEGIPDNLTGKGPLQPVYDKKFQKIVDYKTDDEVRHPMDELCGAKGAKAAGGFFQRVFTVKKRPDPKNGAIVKVGLPPYDFALTVKGEDFTGHVDAGMMTAASRTSPDSLADKSDPARHMHRRINGEALPEAVEPDMYAGALEVHGKVFGSKEGIDPVDAAIASSVAGSYETVGQLIADPNPDDYRGLPIERPLQSSYPETYKGLVSPALVNTDRIKAQLNQGKTPTECVQTIHEVFRCLSGLPLKGTGQLLIARDETPDEVRRRLQTDGVSDRSFHSALFASKFNHEKVTAYDLSIGQGEAVDDPDFKAYLCIVADWRLNQNMTKRPGYTDWNAFMKNKKNKEFFTSEPEWRQSLIYKTSVYYTTGKLPAEFIAALPQGLPTPIISETKGKKNVERPVTTARPTLDTRFGQLPDVSLNALSKNSH